LSVANGVATGVAHTNVWAGTMLLATYDANGLHFYLTDPLGSRRVQTDYAGAVEQTCQSLPFGDGETCSPSPTENLFTGKEHDLESGNDYFGARYYSSILGRFISPDWSVTVEPVPYGKLDDPQSLNLYAYVRNNPVAGVDSDGHDSREEQEQRVQENQASFNQGEAIYNSAMTAMFMANAAASFEDQEQNTNSTTTTVTLNRRPARIPGGQLLHDAGIDHEWITTPEGVSVGMGPANGGGHVPGINGIHLADGPGSPTEVVDHTGEVPISTRTFTGVDKAALATYIKVGTPTGRWVPGVNDCNIWANNVISQSTPHNIYGYLAVPGAGIPILLHQNVVVYADGSIHSPGGQQ